MEHWDVQPPLAQVADVRYFGREHVAVRPRPIPLDQRHQRRLAGQTADQFFSFVLIHHRRRQKFEIADLQPAITRDQHQFQCKVRFEILILL